MGGERRQARKILCEFKGRKLLLAHQCFRRADQGQNNADDVGLSQQLVKGEQAGTAGNLNLGHRARMVVENFHAEVYTGLTSNRMADGIHAENAKCFGKHFPFVEEFSDATLSLREELREPDDREFHIPHPVTPDRGSFTRIRGSEGDHHFT